MKSGGNSLRAGRSKAENRGGRRATPSRALAAGPTGGIYSKTLLNQFGSKGNPGNIEFGTVWRRRPLRRQA